MAAKRSTKQKIPALRLQIAYLDCPSLDKDAANYLMLSQNKLQSFFEFSVINLDSFLGWDANENQGDNILDALDVKNAVMSTDDYLERAHKAFEEAASYEYMEIDEETSEEYISIDSIHEDVKWMIITECRFEGDFYMDGDDDCIILSISNWKDSMAPPSALEFLVRQSQVACAMFCGVDISHIQIKGCLGDYAEALADTKQHVIIGAICYDCEMKVQKQIGKDALQALKAIMDLSWLGKVDEPASVSAILRNTFNYDLETTRGFSPTIQDKLRNILLTSTVQWMVKVVFTILLAWLILMLGLK